MAELQLIAGQLDLTQPERSTTVTLTGATPLSAPGMRLPVLGAAFFASAIPARRAMSVDPMTTLRYD